MFRHPWGTTEYRAQRRWESTNKPNKTFQEVWVSREAKAELPHKTSPMILINRRRMTTRVFLTGVTGQVGGDVLMEMVRRGLEVAALVRKPTQISSCRIIVGDLSNPAPFAAE